MTQVIGALDYQMKSFELNSSKYVFQAFVNV